jgi:2-polyprenyl-6-methoxyphenol hydroxylase-like FAD-dependent oxidoreductase
MRVLICGGSIAGLTLAYWLQQYAIPCVVLEQATNLRRDGYAIDFLGTGYDVAQRMGLIARLEAEQVPLDVIAYVNRAGKPVATLERALLQRITQGKYLALMHQTLTETLYDALGGRVEVRFGRSLASIQSGPDAADVTFTDGTRASFDVLIGADGVHSRTRELVFGPEARFCRFLGYMIASYPLADHYGIGRSWQMYTTPGRLVGAYVSRQEGEIITFFLYHQAQPDR